MDIQQGDNPGISSGSEEDWRPTTDCGWTSTPKRQPATMNNSSLPGLWTAMFKMDGLTIGTIMSIFAVLVVLLVLLLLAFFFFLRHLCNCVNCSIRLDCEMGRPGGQGSKSSGGNNDPLTLGLAGLSDPFTPLGQSGSGANNVSSTSPTNGNGTGRRDSYQGLQWWATSMLFLGLLWMQYTSF